jgi:diacylglycerol O-acyltransferase
VPLYAFGAPLIEAIPIVPLAAQHAIGIAIVSYGGSIAVGISADRDSTHDLDVLVRGIDEGFAELIALLPGEVQLASRTGSALS